MTDPRRHLPGVDVLLASPAFQPFLADFPRSRVVDAVRETIVKVRGELGAEGGERELPNQAEWARRVETLLLTRDRASLRGVINATGVVLHTNLGRAPLSESAREAMARAGGGYSNLEFDLDKGRRGSRYVHCVDLLKEVTGADDALVVNNNAAAVVLGLSTMASGREVLVSRGELVEIGGGFRIPDMISRSGANLREVGTTNRTRIEDYREGAREGPAAAILKVHRSNFRISGFTEEAEIGDLGSLARELGLFLFYDLGSGLLADPEPLGLPLEPTAPESLKRGAQAVAISGDKLLGGPQAGILLGDADVIGDMRKNPLCRAFRVDKVTLAGLEATLRHYLDPEEALREIPTLRMLSASVGEMEARARGLAKGLEDGRADPDSLRVRVAEGNGVVGGGTFPGVDLPGWNVRVQVTGLPPKDFSRALRCQDPPVVARVENEELVLDLRTVENQDDEVVLRAILSAASGTDSGEVPYGGG